MTPETRSRVLAALRRQHIETPSWAFGNSGTRFKVFAQEGVPRTAHEKIDEYLAIFRSLFLEARAIRRAGSAALDLANVAAGTFDGFFEFRLSAWDIAAGAALIAEAGGEVRDFRGGAAYLETGDVIAGSPGVVRDILAAARRAAAGRT